MADNNDTTEPGAQPGPGPEAGAAAATDGQQDTHSLPGGAEPAGHAPGAQGSLPGDPAAQGVPVQGTPAQGAQGPSAPQPPVSHQQAPQPPHQQAYGAQASGTAPQQDAPLAPGAAGAPVAPVAPYAGETQQLPSAGAPAQAYGAEQSGTAFGATAPAEPAAAGQQTATKRGPSNGTFIAGLAIAALIGGIVGGGVSSLVVANSFPTPPSVVQQGSGTVQLNNPDSATEISGVAMVATPSVVTISVETQSEAGSGSGVIYNDDGYIITNAHVVTLDGAASDPKIRVKLSDGRVFDGTLVGTAPYADIAVVKIDAENLTPISVAESGGVNVGDLAVAIGAPMSLSNTVTSGVVSALNRGISVGSALIPQDPNQDGQGDGGGSTPDGEGQYPWDFRFDNPREDGTQAQTGGQVTLPVVQTDASINPGNSGGALLNANGELIGINVAIASPGASEGKASSAGLGFAIPSDLATRMADEIIKGDKPSHGLLGASVVDAELDTETPTTHAGGLIKEIVRGGAAGKAGLKVGDVITAVDGVPAGDGTSVSALVRMHAGGSEVTIDYTRAGNPGQVTATLDTLEW